ncbi:maleylpyruvate isomerase family mycothiol-dependent enzyme [Nonomuraea thailandensis]
MGAGLVRTGLPAPLPDPSGVDPGAPGGWGEWLRAGAEELAEAVRKVGEDAEVWSFLGPAPAAFWLRRMCCEAAVHGYDAALATGAAYGIADDLAADVVTEGMELMSHPRAETFKPELALMRGAGERLAFRPRGMDGWVISRLPEGLRWERGNGPGDVVVPGTVTDIMLVLSRRIPPAAVSGDRALLEHWLAHSAF